MNEPETSKNGQEIAVIGLSIRVVKAKNIEEFWNNLKNGVESILFLSDEELIKAGVSPETLKNPNYIKACSILEDKEYFDAPFFGYTPREAELLNPQVRLFHECSWEALEDAGIDPEEYPGLIGVYAGATQDAEWEYRAMFSPKSRTMGGFAASRLTGIRYLCTRLSYNLNLKGPSITIQTACSTSLVAIHMACQALLSGECDAAIAGGTAVSPKKAGNFFYKEDLIFSPDGHTRSFDANGKGTLFGEGAGVVILKTLEDAITNNDNIYAIIKSSVINNDGNRKIGFTAPSVEAQVEMMRAAYHLANIKPESITYVEAHGTATPLGDPIEFESLKQAFRTNKKRFCKLGSVKTNVGHLDTVAGIAGFIKAVLALKYKEIPPVLFFETPNPEINIVESPFLINTELIKWERGNYPLRAAVNSLGMGGTNAHVVLEEAPGKRESSPSRDYQLLLLSARSKNSLDRMTENLAGFLKRNKEIKLADVVYTLQTRRKKFKFRKSLVCRDVNEAIEALTAAKIAKVREYYSENDNKKIIFMFPGQGTQYINMGLNLYQEEEIFRREIDRCLNIVKPYIGFDLKDILYPTSDNIEKAKEEIDNVLVTPALVFIIEYALARLLMEWGIKPDGMIGHSFGEYTAACMSGVFSLEEALQIITFRSMLMSRLPQGVMMSVPLSATQLSGLLTDDIAIAIDNGSSCIISGSKEAVETFAKEMKEKRHICQYVQISVACHSQAMNSILDEFRAKIETLHLNPPQTPFISNVTGTWITDDEALSPEYWVNHLRKTVRFADGIKKLVEKEDTIYLEVGPGNVLSGIVFQYLEKKSGKYVINLLKHPGQDMSDISFLLNKIGRLWLYGINFDWPSFYSKEARHCIYLPPYAFDKERYWLEPISLENLGYGSIPNKKKHILDWFHAPSWHPVPQLKLNTKSNRRGDKMNRLIFLDDVQIGSKLCEKLASCTNKIVTVKIGQTFLEEGENKYIIDPGNYDHYRRLWARLKEAGTIPREIIHLWGIDGNSTHKIDGPSIEDGQNRGFYSLLFLTQVMEMLNGNDKFDMIIITDNMQKVTGDEIISPIKSTVLGPVFVIPQEYINIDCRSIDISLPIQKQEIEQLLELLTDDILSPKPEKIAAYRNNWKWKPMYQEVKFEKDLEASDWTLKENGVYLLTGGLGGVGHALAQDFAKNCNIKIVIVGRTQLPEKKEWDSWISSHDDQDPISLKIKKLQVLEESNGEVLYFSADVADVEAIQKVIAGAKERFGAINGIIHAAGGTKGESIGFIRNLDRSKCHHQFKAKINGLIVLDRLFKDESLDFLILTSSMTSFLGGWEYAAYTAANFFMDRFVISTGRWISINLDPVNLDNDKNAEITLDIGELKQIFKYVIANVGKGQIMVSKTDLHDRINKATRSLRAEKDNDSQREISNQGKKSAHFFPRPGLTTPYVPPADEVEAGLVEICRELFGYDKIGVMDDLFDLGGDSLTLIQFIAQIQAKFDVKVRVHDIFNKGQLRELSQHIREAEKEKYLSIENVEKKEYYPLSSAQKRLYIIQQIEKNSTAYNVPWPFELRGVLDKKKLEDAFLKIIRRHENLRTSFHLLQSDPVQRVQENAEFEIIYETAREKPEINEIIKHFIQPFDLSIAPLIRVIIIKLEENYHVLMINIHHIICDWHSMKIFLKDFIAMYTGKSLHPLKLSYKDYSQWENSEMQQEAIYKQKEYWLKRFRGEPPMLNLPTDFPRTASIDFDGERIGFNIDTQLTEEIRKILSETGTTLFMFLLTIYTTLLFTYTGQEDIVVGVPTAGRNHKDLKDIFGMFVNMLPMRNYPQPEKTFRQFLNEVKEISLQGFENQDYPFENLISNLDLTRHSSKTPLVETILTILRGQNQTVNETGNTEIELEVKEWLYEKYPAKFELALDAVENSRFINMWLTYSTRLFKRSTIEKVKNHYLEILGQAITDLDIKLKDIVISHELAEAEPDFLHNDSGDFGF